MADRSCKNCRYLKKIEIKDDKTGLIGIYECQDDYFQMEEHMLDSFCCEKHCFRRADQNGGGAE